MTFFEYMMDQFSGATGGMMCCFAIGMILMIPLGLLSLSIGTKIGAFLGEGVAE